MTLTASQLEAREGKVTASFLPALMTGDRDRILSEWQRIIGAPDWVGDDLTGNWPVQLGSFLEPFVLDWHARKTTELTWRGEVVVHPQRPYFCCTLDAFRPSDDTVIDVKVVGHWRRIDDVIAHYTPQMVGQAGCMSTANAALLIVHGGAEPVEYPVTWTPDYEAAVWHRVDDFWQCCENLTAPFAVPALAPPVAAVRIVRMEDNPDWKAGADLWLQTYGAAESARAAEKALKGLVPDDAAKCIGCGVIITRDKAGRLSLRKS